MSQWFCFDKYCKLYNFNILVLSKKRLVRLVTCRYPHSLLKAPKTTHVQEPTHHIYHAFWCFFWLHISRLFLRISHFQVEYTSPNSGCSIATLDSREDILYPEFDCPTVFHRDAIGSQCDCKLKP